MVCVSKDLLLSTAHVRFRLIVNKNIFVYVAWKPDFWIGAHLLGGVHKLRLQDEVGRWSKNVHFVSTFIPCKMSMQGARRSKKAKTQMIFECDELASRTSKHLNCLPSSAFTQNLDKKQNTWQTNQFLPYSNNFLLSADF